MKMKTPRKLLSRYRNVETSIMYVTQEADAARFLGNHAAYKRYMKDVPALVAERDALWKQIDDAVDGTLEAIKMLYYVVNGRKKFG